MYFRYAYRQEKIAGSPERLSHISAPCKTRAKQKVVRERYPHILGKTRCYLFPRCEIEPFAIFDFLMIRVSQTFSSSVSFVYEAESRKLKDRYNEIQSLLANYARQSRDAKEFADLVEQYTNITELTEELLHTLIEKVVVHEKEVIDGETVMRIDIYYRFIGKVGNEDGETLKATKSRRASIPLALGA